VRDRLVALGVAASRVEADGEAGTGGEGAVRFEVAGLTVAEALRFAPRSSEVDAEARAVLDELVSTLLLAPAAVRVVGFAGASDGRVVLDELARARADAVADYLAYAGLDRARLRVSAEVDPRGDAASRRVELRAGR
jgi:outer membrane protein OmpA-like peptidoglycan-associated protein